MASVAIGCRVDAVPAPDVITVSVRAPPGTARVVARVSTGDPVELRRHAGGTELVGELHVTSGSHAVTIGRDDDPGARSSHWTFSVTVTHGDPAQLALTLPSDVRESGPVLRALVSGRSSVVMGTASTLQAIADPDAREVEYSWSTTPPGCGSFDNTAAASTSWTATSAGRCIVTSTVTAAGRVERRGVEIVVRSLARSYRYPLQVSQDGRHLVDARGTPFLVKGETAWLALVNLTEEEQEHYLADRELKGFNLVEVMLLNADYTNAPNPVPPANRYGEQPFRDAGRFATPVDAYFDRAAAFVERAARHGIVVLLAPMYLGFDGGREGWYAALESPQNDRDSAYRYGVYVGARFRDLANVLWVAGGDFAPPAGSEGETRHWEMLRGIVAAGAPQLWTGHWNFRHLGGISTDEERFAPAMAVNGVYQYVNPYEYTLRAYDVNPRRPVFLLESTYEREHPRTSLQPFRKAWWWAMLSGASGLLWSNNFLWMCESARGTYAAEYGTTADRTTSSWAAELESPGTYEALHLHALFEALPWHRLRPAGAASGSGAIVTSGQGHRAKRIVAAAAPEGDALVVYVPPTGVGRRSFTIDASLLRGPTRARWYDPSTGAYVALDEAWVPSGHVELTTPGRNGSRVNDWLLVVDRPDPSPAP